jgi:hypothetical protein
LRVVNLAGGIIEHHQQIVAAAVPQPGVRAAIQMQQHARQRTTRSPPAMHPAPPPLGHQSGTLQRQLHPGVAQGNAMLLPQLLVKMAHVEIEILLAIQRQHPLS